MAVALGLAGCNDLSKAMSSLESDDGTQAIKAPPLSLPPDYNLRPPVPGGRGDPNRVNVDQARQNMFGSNTPNPDEGVADTRSAGEAALLSIALTLVTAMTTARAAKPEPRAATMGHSPLSSDVRDRHISNIPIPIAPPSPYSRLAPMVPR